MTASDSSQYVVDTTMREKMPLLNAVVQQHKSTQPFQDVTILLIQHQLQDSYGQISAFIELGVAPENIHWIDIPYTSFASVRTAIQRDFGVPARNFHVSTYRLDLPYREHQCRRIGQWLNTQGEALRNRRLLVVDDGAYFLEGLSYSDGEPPVFSIVEQSQTAIKRLRTEHRFATYLQRNAIVNVAESEPKKRLESPMIASAIGDALMDALTRRKARRVISGRCLILGYGSIGALVAQTAASRLGFAREKIHVYDADQSRQQEAIVSGYPLWKRDKFSIQFHLVVGCSGACSFTVQDHIYLADGACLASASTGSVELSREQFVAATRVKAQDTFRMPQLERLADADIHSDLEFLIDSRRIYFLNAGFPINFDGNRIDRIPLGDIQLTAALMVRGAIQAVGLNDPGLIPLDKDYCLNVSQSFLAGRPE